MKKTKWTTKDMPDQTGKVFVITGSNTGLGYEAALALAKKDATVVLAIRNLAKGEAAKKSIIENYPNAKIELQLLDLDSLDSVKAGANDLINRFPVINCLICNGATLGVKGLTSYGVESRLGVNMVSHLALVQYLLPHLESTPNTRIISIGSVAAKDTKTTLFDSITTPIDDDIDAYSRSKIANVIFALKLAEKVAGTNVISVCAHPGLSSTDIFKQMPKMIQLMTKLLKQPAAQGALPILYAATMPAVVNGQYYGPNGKDENKGYPTLVPYPPLTLDKKIQDELWQKSEDFLKPYLTK